MKLLVTGIIICSILSFSPALSAVENGSGITMKVNILDNTCTVDAALGNVNIGLVALRDLQAHGGHSPEVPFTITLKNCGAFAKKVSIYTRGETYAGRNDILKLSGSGDPETAIGVGIVLRDSNRRIIPINHNEQPIIEKLIAGDNTSIQFSAEYALTGEVPRSGKADSEVMFTFSYE